MDLSVKLQGFPQSLSWLFGVFGGSTRDSLQLRIDGAEPDSIRQKAHLELVEKVPSDEERMQFLILLCTSTERLSKVIHEIRDEVEKQSNTIGQFLSEKL